MTANQTNNKKTPIFGRGGAGLALVALLFLPLGGCHGAGMTGIEALGSHDITGGVKFLLFICIACAGLGLLAYSAGLCFATGAGGIASLLIAYTVIRQNVPIDLMIGSYLAILGFIGLVGEGTRQASSNKPNDTGS